MDLNINPSFKDACPPLKEDEYKRLEENILSDGIIIDPIIVWGGTIIDGHNRYSISQEHSLAFNIKEMQFDSESDAIIWIKEHQLGTRNLEDHQAWALVQDIAELLKKKGEEKRVQTLKQGDESPDLSTVDRTGHNTQQELADKLGWSAGKVAAAQYVDKHADDDLKDEVYSGKKTFNKAYKEIKSYNETFTEEFVIIEKFEDNIMKVRDKCLMHDFMAPTVDRLNDILDDLRNVKDKFANN